MLRILKVKIHTAGHKDEILDPEYVSKVSKRLYIIRNSNCILWGREVCHQLQRMHTMERE